MIIVDGSLALVRVRFSFGCHPPSSPFVVVVVVVVVVEKPETWRCSRPLYPVSGPSAPIVEALCSRTFSFVLVARQSRRLSGWHGSFRLFFLLSMPRQQIALFCIACAGSAGGPAVTRLAPFDRATLTSFFGGHASSFVSFHRTLSRSQVTRVS